VHNALSAQVLINVKGGSMEPTSQRRPMATWSWSARTKIMRMTMRCVCCGWMG